MRVLLAAMLLLPAFGGDELIFHVAPRAGAPGSFDSLHEAQRAVRAAPRDRDVVVLIEAGVYELSEPLRFGPRDGGGDQHSVTWRAREGAQVVLSGGRVLDNWQVANDGTWSHAALAERQLFEGDTRLPIARFPAEGWLRVAAAERGARTSFQHAGDVPEASQLRGAQILLLHDWSTSRVPLLRLEEPTRSVHLAHPVGAWHPFFFITNFEPHPRYAFENARAGWDAPGEWMQVEGHLVYRPRPGESPDRAAVVAPRLRRLITVAGDADEPVRGLRFEGLSLRYSAATARPAGYAGIQAAFCEDRSRDALPQHALAPEGAVQVTHAQDFHFVDCAFEHLGGCGLVLGAGAREGSIRRCRFTDLGANGIMIGEAQYPPKTPSARDLVTHIRCEDNTLERCGQLDLGAVGIWVGVAAEVQVLHNELRDLPYTGISLGWIWGPEPSPSRGHRVERNHIHHVMQVLSDGGGIYTLGRQPDTRIAGNLIHDVPRHAGRAPSNGLFVDQGSCEMLFEGNVIHAVSGAPIRFHMAGSNVLTGNTLVTAGSPFAYDACEPEVMTFADNSVVNPEAWEPAPIEVGPRRAR